MREFTEYSIEYEYKHPQSYGLSPVICYGDGKRAFISCGRDDALSVYHDTSHIYALADNHQMDYIVLEIIHKATGESEGSVFLKDDEAAPYMRMDSMEQKIRSLSEYIW